METTNHLSSEFCNPEQYRSGAYLKTYKGGESESNKPPIIKLVMETAAKLDIPLTAELGTGTNWLDTKKSELWL